MESNTLTFLKNDNPNFYLYIQIKLNILGVCKSTKQIAQPVTHTFCDILEKSINAPIASSHSHVECIRTFFKFQVRSTLNNFIVTIFMISGSWKSW